MVTHGEIEEASTCEVIGKNEEGLSQQEVAAALERIRFAIRQRTAERAVSEEVAQHAGLHDVPLALRQMWEASTFREPALRSHRRVLGRLVLLFKKVGFHFFAKWYVRPILEQQEAFNRATFHAMKELLGDHDPSPRKLARVPANPAERHDDPR